MVGSNDQKGMSLMEVLVTMFMVALISSNLLGGFIISHQMIKQAEQETRASSFAYQILEDLRARPAQDWVDLAAANKKDSSIFISNSDQNYGVDLQATVGLNKNRDNPSLYDVKVEVIWENNGRSRMLEMVTTLNPALRGVTI